MTDIEERPLKTFYLYEVTGHDEDGLSFRYLVVAEDPKQARAKVREQELLEWGQGKISLTVLRKSWLYAEETLEHDESLLRELRTHIPIPIWESWGYTPRRRRLRR